MLKSKYSGAERLLLKTTLKMACQTTTSSRHHIPSGHFRKDLHVGGNLVLNGLEFYSTQLASFGWDV